MKFRTIPMALVLSFTLAVLLSGCGKPGDRTVAKVGDYKISTHEFTEYFKNMGYAFVTAQDEFDKKRELLDSMTVDRLLIQAAYEKGIDRSEELARVVLANKDKFLLDILYKKEVADKTNASEAEMKDFYNHLEYKIRASHIMVNDSDTAQMLFERLKAGENFEKLAYEYSIAPTAKKDKGDLGYFTWGVHLDALQETAFSMEPSEISPPVVSEVGIHIIKLTDRLPNEQRKDFKSMKAGIKSQILNRKRFLLMKEFFDTIAERYPITVDTATCEFLLHKREMLYPPQLLESLPKDDFDLDQLDRNERELVLATWDGGQMTLYQYLTEVQAVPSHVKPDLDDYDSLAAIIFALKRTEMLVIEAHRRGLDSDPEFVRKLKLFKELNMADLMRNDSIPEPLPPDEGMVRQYYDEHPDEFTTPAKVHVYEILLSDELKAKKLKKDLNNLAAFKDRAVELTERIGKRAQMGDLGYITEFLYPEIFNVAIKTPVDSIGGPVVSRGKYSIFWVADKLESELKDFLGVKRDIHFKLTAEQKQRSFNAWLDQRKESTPIEIDDDALWATIDMDSYAAADTTQAIE